MKQFKALQFTAKNILPGSIGLLVMAFGIMAFQDPTNVTVKHKPVVVDSPPQKNINVDIEFDMKDLDQTIKKSMEMAEKAMKEIDFSAMQKKISESMKDIDLSKLEMDLQKAIKETDWNQMKTEMDKTMKIDMDKLKVDMDKMKAEIKLSMKDINMDEMKKSMEELKKINFDDMKKEMEKVKKEMNINKDQWKAEMDKARVEIEKSKEGLMEKKNMANELEKDGLINKTESNSIEFKDKELYINGKKQSPEITEKYRKYFKGDSLKFKFNFEK
jgi:hypothetical protein